MVARKRKRRRAKPHTSSQPRRQHEENTDRASADAEPAVAKPRERATEHQIGTAQRQEAVEAQQRTVGNAATMALLQRQDDADAAPATAGDEQEEQVLTYRVVIDGTEHYLTPAQYQALRDHTIDKLRAAIRVIRSHARIGKETEIEFLNETHTWVGTVSDFFAGVEPPGLLMWDLPVMWCDGAESALERGRMEVAAQRLQWAEKLYNDAHRTWYNYREATIGGAQAAVTTLEVTRDVSFAVAGALGGAALTPVGASLIVQGGASALASGAGKLIEETATRGSEMYHGLRQEWDLAGHLKSAGTAAITGFAGTLVAGPLANKFYSGVLGGLSDDAAKTMAIELTEETGEEVTEAMVHEMFATKGHIWLRKFLSESVGGAGSTVLQETIKATLDGMEQGKMISPEKFAEIVAGEFVKGEGAGKFVAFAKRYAKASR